MYGIVLYIEATGETWFSLVVFVWWGMVAGYVGCVGCVGGVGGLSRLTEFLDYVLRSGWWDFVIREQKFFRIAL